MLLQAPRLLHNVKISRRHIWPQRTTLRRCSDSSDEKLSFQHLRAEMLGREATCFVDMITAEPSLKLTQVLSNFLPDQWRPLSAEEYPVLPTGHHLVYFNQDQPADTLLPDGTDAFHSPGKPWTRRMWAGGSMLLKPDIYFNKNKGMVFNNSIIGAERIKDVQMMGGGADAKIFVTVERRYARFDIMHQRYRRSFDNNEIKDIFRRQFRDDELWGDALLKTEHKLVFLREKTASERKAIEAGQTFKPRYLDQSNTPHFLHSFVPTPSLLLHYSTLTRNAHRIHLDQEYARNVEGHRNVLVHGPLLLTVMLQAITGHLAAQISGRHLIKSVEYRNLAPLYCNEKTTVCGKETKTFYDGSLYEIWIQGPTGGVAVICKVRTVKNRFEASEPSIPVVNSKSFVSLAERIVPKETFATTKGKQKRAVSQELDDRVEEVGQKEARTVFPSDTATALATNQPLTEYRNNRVAQAKPSGFFLLPEPSLSVRFVDTAAPEPLRPTMSHHSRGIAHRIMKPAEDAILESIPIVRYHNATPYERDPDMIASRHSKFKRDGVHLLRSLRIRFQAKRLERSLDQDTTLLRTGRQSWL